MACTDAILQVQFLAVKELGSRNLNFTMEFIPKSDGNSTSGIRREVDTLILSYRRKIQIQIHQRNDRNFLFWGKVDDRNLNQIISPSQIYQTRQHELDLQFNVSQFRKL